MTAEWNSKHENKFAQNFKMLFESTLDFSPNPFLTKWDLRFLRIAHEVSTWSKDPGTKVGCVIVNDRRILSTGYNGFPKSISDSLDRYRNREYKLSITIHAESNAILNAAKNGTKVDGATLYVTFPPCSQCASAIVQAGITRVVSPNPNFAPDRWKQSFLRASDLFFEAGITVHYFTEADPWKVANAPPAGPDG